MGKELTGLSVTGNEYEPMDAAQNIDFGLETHRFFTLLNTSEEMVGQLYIALTGDIILQTSLEPTEVMKEVKHHNANNDRESNIAFEHVDPKTNQGFSYRAKKQLHQNDYAYVDIVTNTGYSIQPTANSYDYSQRRDIGNLNLRSVQVSIGF